jgi:uncharacterized protein YacL
MSHLLNHFSFQAAKWNGGMLFVLAFIWLCVIGCVISSILSQSPDRSQRIFWIAIVVLLPVVGVLAYLPFACNRKDLPLLFMRKPKKRTAAKSDDEEDYKSEKESTVEP